MKKIILLCLLSFSINAQTKLGFSTNIGFIDSPDGLVFSPELSIENKITSRIYFSNELSYSNEKQLTNIVQNNTGFSRKRLQLNSGLKIGLIEKQSFKLKLKGGFSSLYKNEYHQGGFRLLPDNTYEYPFTIEKGYDFGGFGGIETEFKVKEKTSLFADFSYQRQKNTGMNYAFGFGAYYSLGKK